MTRANTIAIALAATGAALIWISIAIYEAGGVPPPQSLRYAPMMPLAVEPPVIPDRLTRLIEAAAAAGYRAGCEKHGGVSSVCESMGNDWATRAFDDAPQESHE